MQYYRTYYRILDKNSNDFLDDSLSSSLLNFYLSTYLYVLIRIKPILKMNLLHYIDNGLTREKIQLNKPFTFSKFDTGSYYLHSNKTPIKRQTMHIYSMNRK